MSYIGRGLDAISNVEKLDNITFDGSATYALTKSSAAFTPVGANNLLVSIDGVVQMGNFSVSTTNISFDWSPTSSNTNNFILHYGTGVLNVPADGSIVAAKMAANSVDSDSYVDGSIDAVHLSANSVDSDAYVDGSIDNAHLADDAVGVAELSATGTASSSTFLRGDNAWVAAGGLTSQIVQVQYDIATADGTLAITGAGFAPETVIVFSTVSSTPKWGFGMGTKTDDDYRCTVNNYNNSADNAAPESQIVSVYTGNEPTMAQAVIDSWDADGITLSWTKTRSPTGTVNMYFMFNK